MLFRSNLPLGPLALADIIGLDVCHTVLSNLATSLGNRFSPPALLTELVQSGRTGRKVGAGFFVYGPPPGEESDREQSQGRPTMLVEESE